MEEQEIKYQESQTENQQPPLEEIQHVQPSPAETVKKKPSLLTPFLVIIIIITLCISVAAKTIISPPIVSTPYPTLIIPTPAKSTSLKAYPVPKNIMYTPQSEDSINSPFYTLWIGGFRDIYISNSKGEKIYYGSDTNKITSIIKPTLPGSGADLASSDGVAQEFIIYPDIVDTYQFQVSNVVWTEGTIIDIKFGYGDRINEIYYQLVFRDLPIKDETFEFSISPEGIETSSEWKENNFNSDATNPIKIVL